MERAIADGADWVEVDVQETTDGEVVVVHDSDFMKLAGVPLKVWEATIAEVEAVDVGSRFDPAFAGERVPTLAAVLEACRGRAASPSSSRTTAMARCLRSGWPASSKPAEWNAT